MANGSEKHIYCITEVTKRKNLTDIDTCGRVLKENSNRYLGQVSKFNDSPAFISENKK